MDISKKMERVLINFRQSMQSGSGTVNFRRWSKEEEAEMVTNLIGGSPLPQIAERQGRSVRAILIRLGAILNRDPHHPDFIVVDRSRLDGGLVKRAVDMYTQQQETGSSSVRPMGTSSTVIVPSDDIHRILDAVGELRSEVRKLRAQIRHYHKNAN